jgi:hypothetical protein
MFRIYSAALLAAAGIALLALAGPAAAGWIDDDGSGNNWIQGDIAVHVEQYVPGGAILTVSIADRLVNTSAQDLYVRVPLQFARSTWPDMWVSPLAPTDHNLWSHTHGGLTKTMQAFDSPIAGDEFMMMDITGVEDIRLHIPDPLFPGVWLDSPNVAPFGRILITNPEGFWHIQGTTIVSVVPEPGGAAPIALTGLSLLLLRRRLRQSPKES